MSDLDLSQVEEVEVPLAPPNGGLPFPIPDVDTVIKQAAINVMKGTDNNGNPAVLLQFITRSMMYSIQLSGEAATALSDELRPSGLVRATAADLPKGA